VGSDGACDGPDVAPGVDGGARGAELVAFEVAQHLRADPGRGADLLDRHAGGLAGCAQAHPDCAVRGVDACAPAGVLVLHGRHLLPLAP
jgi:hypothetical protein